VCERVGEVSRAENNCLAINGIRRLHCCTSIAVGYLGGWFGGRLPIANGV